MRDALLTALIVGAWAIGMFGIAIMLLQPSLIFGVP
jgi:hypothetical protein